MRLIKLAIENFKGIRSKEIDFGALTEISGENGTCKTTIGTAYYWLMSDVDYDMGNNPNVRPEGADDGIITKVEGTFDFDGKTVTFAKIQKVKTKTGNDGKTKTTKVNSFEVNSVPKSQRDAFKYLEDLGFDGDLFLPLSHVNAFLKDFTEKKARQNIRSVLFGMTTALSDREVAYRSGLKGLAALLDNYTVDEVTAVQNASKRKISQEYGRNGEIIDYKIDGLNAGKVEIDTESIESKKAEIAAEIRDIEKQIADSETETGQMDGLLNEISELERQKFEHVREIQIKNQERKDDVSRQIYEAKLKVNSVQSSIEATKKNIVDAEYEVKRMNEAIKAEQASYKKVKAEKFEGIPFDDKSLVCPTCGRPFEPDKADEIRKAHEKSEKERAKKFQADKKLRLEEITKRGKSYQEQRDKATESAESFKEKLSELEVTLTQHKTALNTLEMGGADTLPETDDFTAEIDSKVASLREKTAEFDNSAVRAELNAKLKAKQEEYHALDRELAKEETNARIDAQIAELQKKRIEHEQARLDCERILDEVNQLEMAKNDMLTEQINSHFKLVRWKLFEVQANGEILTDRCVPYIDGHSMADAVNTGRLILGKLDIVSALQRFYGKSYPVFLDNAESLTGNTKERIELDSQLILLKAVEGAELTVK